MHEAWRRDDVPVVLDRSAQTTVGNAAAVARSPVASGRASSSSSPRAGMHGARGRSSGRRCAAPASASPSRALAGVPSRCSRSASSSARRRSRSRPAGSGAAEHGTSRFRHQLLTSRVPPHFDHASAAENREAGFRQLPAGRDDDRRGGARLLRLPRDPVGPHDRGRNLRARGRSGDRLDGDRPAARRDARAGLGPARRQPETDGQPAGHEPRRPRQRPSSRALVADRRDAERDVGREPRLRAGGEPGVRPPADHRNRDGPLRAPRVRARLRRPDARPAPVEVGGTRSARDRSSRRRGTSSSGRWSPAVS